MLPSNLFTIHFFIFFSRHPRSLPFRKPVDPVALGIFPAYNQIITHPIDLGTIKTQIGKLKNFGQKLDISANVKHLTPNTPLIQLWCARSKWNMDLKIIFSS